ncbi:MAG: lysylphosphatidylglycerol synthase domain-containing protein [Alphaproteobacteria bacterium]
MSTAGDRRRGLAGLGLGIGLALFAALVAWQGLGDVVATLRVAGAGLLVVAAFHVVPMTLDALGWRALLPPSGRPPASEFALGRWIGESVNSLLPVMQIGGSLARTGFLRRRGVAGGPAAASVVVDVTLVVLSQVAFSLLGVGLLVTLKGGGRLGIAAAVGALLMSGLAAGFWVAQRRGLFGAGGRALERFLEREEGPSIGLRAEEIDRSVAAIHADRAAMLGSFGWHLASWVAGAGEVWLALRFLGTPVGMSGALLLESLGQAVRAAAFAVPGALGVQEGGYVVLGGALGIPPDTCLALSLAKRAREILLGLPGLLAWRSETAATRLVAPRPPAGGGAS